MSARWVSVAEESSYLVLDVVGESIRFCLDADGILDAIGRPNA